MANSYKSHNEALQVQHLEIVKNLRMWKAGQIIGLLVIEELIYNLLNSDGTRILA